MRSTRLATVTAVLLIAAIAAPLAAKPRRSSPPPIIVCQEVLAKGDAVWIADKEIEVGELSGLLNGAFYLAYSDEATGTIDPSDGGPNLVITTKSGKLEVWLYGESTLQEDGSWNRKLAAATVQGSGDFAGATADLALTGMFYPEKGGGYQLTGSLCASSTQRARR